MAIVVTTADTDNAVDFLEAYLADKVPAGDYSAGSAFRDLTVKALAFVFAYLKNTNEQIRVRQSLLTVTEVDTSDDADAADNAVDALLANWFLTRKGGNYSRVLAFGHSTSRVDITIPATAVFSKVGGINFKLDNNGNDLVISAEDLVAQADSRHQVSDYVFKFPLVSVTAGDETNVPAGAFTTYTPFNAYVTSIETLEEASGGTPIETSEEFIERSKTALTTRNLINARSNDAVLKDTFPAIRQVTTVGMGDPEMVRDIVREGSTRLAFHVGGHMDVFVATSPTETTFVGEVGGAFTRTDGVINVFKESTGLVRFSTDFGVQAGMILQIKSGFTQTAVWDYVIKEVADDYLIVSERNPFPYAVDEQATPGYLTWSVGVQSPSYADVVPQQSLTGESSRQIKKSGSVFLPAKPLYYIKDVSIADPLDADADPLDGAVHFNVRVNRTPLYQPAPQNEYQVIVHNPEAHQSDKSFIELVLQPSDGTAGRYDGKSVKVTYDTVAGYDNINYYVTNAQQKIGADSTLVRGYHPVYVSCSIEYKLSRKANVFIDPTEAASLVAAYINNYIDPEPLDVSLISNFLRTAYPDISNVYPFELVYEVHVPDGRVVLFTSTEAVTIPSDPTMLRSLQNDADDSVEGLINPLDYGLSNDTITVLSFPSLITVTQR